MQDYRPKVERALRSIGCHPVDHAGEGVWLWYSPRSLQTFTLDETIPTQSMGNEVLRLAGHTPIFSDI